MEDRNYFKDIKLLKLAFIYFFLLDSVFKISNTPVNIKLAYLVNTYILHNTLGFSHFLTVLIISSPIFIL